MVGNRLRANKIQEMRSSILLVLNLRENLLFKATSRCLWKGVI